MKIIQHLITIFANTLRSNKGNQHRNKQFLFLYERSHRDIYNKIRLRRHLYLEKTTAEAHFINVRRKIRQQLFGTFLAYAVKENFVPVCGSFQWVCLPSNSYHLFFSSQRVPSSKHKAPPVKSPKMM